MQPLLGSDSTQDLAVLTICCSQTFEPVMLSADRARQGSDVVVVGYPLGSEMALMTRGIVSGVMFDASMNGWIVQTDAPLNPGNSGGPALYAGWRGRGYQHVRCQRIGKRRNG